MRGSLMERCARCANANCEPVSSSMVKQPNAKRRAKWPEATPAKQENSMMLDQIAESTAACCRYRILECEGYLAGVLGSFKAGNRYAQ
jgi:hypothetical protein